MKKKKKKERKKERKEQLFEQIEEHRLKKKLDIEMQCLYIYIYAWANSPPPSLYYRLIFSIGIYFAEVKIPVVKRIRSDNLLFSSLQLHKYHHIKNNFSFWSTRNNRTQRHHYQATHTRTKNNKTGLMPASDSSVMEVRPSGSGMSRHQSETVTPRDARA